MSSNPQSTPARKKKRQCPSCLKTFTGDHAGNLCVKAKGMNWKHREGIMTHPAQWLLWNALRDGTVTQRMTLREIARKIKVNYPQQVLHHIDQLEKKGYLVTGWWQGKRYWKLTDKLPPELTSPTHHV